MNEAFAKAHRLLKKTEFQFTLDQGKRAVCAHFIVFAAKNRDSNLWGRLGLIVSRKVGKANIRNRFKRQIREIFRVNKDQFPGLDIVIIGKKSAANASANDLSIALLNCLSQLNLRLARSA